VICERFDVVVVPFPFAEIAALKRRPAVVISGRRFNEDNQSTVVAMITSSKRTERPSDIVIRDVSAAGLHVECRVRWRLATLPNELILRSIGKLGGFDRLSCERELGNMLT
jgi:mRNA interferase MazF